MEDDDFLSEWKIFKEEEMGMPSQFLDSASKE